ncbi:MAG TPA: DUF1343 domain-containing protein [Gemmatimonadales bacterium]|nr:DUF1343 domain-containing protein [Gemmatimonadales bacterium]
MKPSASHVWLCVLGVLGLPVTCPGQGPAAPPPTELAVRPGIEVLISDSMQLVRRRRVGLVTNQAGVDSKGVSDVERLRGAGVNLVALFSPEHGFRGTAAPGAVVGSSTDSATGLPIYSLYGANTAPSDEMLTGIDILLVDLQDAGARYYTYLFTTTQVMRSAARNRIPVVVLDRPNPIGGAVQGNVLDPAYASPVGLLAIPMRHGMTLGELAQLAKHDLGLSTDLRVVPMRGWSRSMYFDETGLPFIPPSPNLKTVESLIHYPGTCLFEGTNLSVGRGTDHPFEQVGAPWLDTAAVLSWLRHHSVPGVEFHGVKFTPHDPGDGKYADTTVVGIRLSVTDRSIYDPTALAIRLLQVLELGLAGNGDPQEIVVGPQRVFPAEPRQFDRLAGDGGDLRKALMAMELDPAPRLNTVLQSWDRSRSEFLARRRPFLIYPE